MKMRCALITILLPGIAWSLFGAEPTKDWALVKQTNGVAIYSRPHEGSNLKEFKAIGEIDATTETVHKVIDDVEAYTSFMPYTAECRVIERDPDSILTYHRVPPKILRDRHYTLRIPQESGPVEKGLAYLNPWEPAPEKGQRAKPAALTL